MYFGRRVRHDLDVKNRLLGSGGLAPQCGNDGKVVFDVDKVASLEPDASPHSVSLSANHALAQRSPALPHMPGYRGRRGSRSITCAVVPSSKYDCGASGMSSVEVMAAQLRAVLRHVPPDFSHEKRAAICYP